MTVSSGIASFTDLGDSTAETITLHFTSVPVVSSVSSNSVVVSAPNAIHLVIHVQPSPAATAGVAFAAQPVVYVEDQNGHLETGDNTTQVTVTSIPTGSGPLHGTTTIKVSGGIATFSGLSDNKAETITLKFTSASAIPFVTSNSIAVSPAATSQLVIHTQPSPTAKAGVPFPTQPVIYVEDRYGNLESGDSSTAVTVSLPPRTSGALRGLTRLVVSHGVAKFTNLAENTAEAIALQFTSVPALTTAVSSNILISPAAANQLVIHTQPAPTATIGVPFKIQPVIYIEDVFGNLVTGDSSTKVSVVSVTNPSRPLLGMTTATASRGIVTFTNLASSVAAIIKLGFTSSPALLQAISNSIVVRASGSSSTWEHQVTCCRALPNSGRIRLRRPSSESPVF